MTLTESSVTKKSNGNFHRDFLGNERHDGQVTDGLKWDYLSEMLSKCVRKVSSSDISTYFSPNSFSQIIFVTDNKFLCSQQPLKLTEENFPERRLQH
ncbi:CLUMA_CG001841, isoform A [Clunio marinus]|uniref:CLUMA_CG001841, isoform A n=1 Tax=Clunio marinus TaxID=568069 RepID=A0A1J1HJ34_9DIPT|nr:CLUMA_CG001841, isoform A [Clunio marinus]